MRSATCRSLTVLLSGVMAFAGLIVSPAWGATLPDAVGGGFTRCGILGEYFANADLSGSPAFSRRDVRIDFDWGDLLPIGGSNYYKLRTFPRDNFSVRWTGQVIPRFTEDYTFVAVADEGVRVRLKAASASTWATLIDQWGAAGTYAGPAQSLAAGQAYDIQVEYRDLTGPASCRLLWSSRSTPMEVVDPLSAQGLNAASYAGYIWADKMKFSRYYNTEDTIQDTLGWPKADRSGDEFCISESDSRDRQYAGWFTLSFRGQARVSGGCCNTISFRVGTQTYTQLPRGTGYDAGTNTTTARMFIDGSRLVNLHFDQTSRTGTTANNTGVTDIRLMMPIAPDDTASHDTGEVVYRLFKQAVATRYTCIRWLEGANGNTDSVWADRTLPGHAFFSRAKPGVYWSEQENWEYLIMACNETGKDLYLSLPIKACDDYFAKLANLLRYGSDGVTPYTSPQTNPVYPPLNPNLRVYMEVGNEIWNWAFVSTGQCRLIAIAQGQNTTALWQVMNYDNSLNASDCGIYGMRRWLDTRTVACSNAFRGVFGDAGMGPRARMLVEYQYNDAQETAGRSFQMFSDYYNNGKGNFVANPHPANYYLWGAGGATYYGVGNSWGRTTATLVPDSSFETPAITAGTLQQAPGGSPWTFTGTAGIYYQSGSTAIGALGTPDAAAQGNQAAYIIDGGTIAATVNFVHTGWFALGFNAAYGTNGNNFDMYFDSDWISPKAQGDDRLPYTGDHAGLGGWSRDTRDLASDWGSAVFHVTAAGNHTIRFVGSGTGGQVLLLDNVRIRSVDSIVESGFGSGQAAGQVAGDDYRLQLNSQAKYARTFGLPVVSYEAGWSLGGDFTQQPIQNWTKFHDPRAARINNTAEDIWRESGSALQVWGVYAYWPGYAMTNVDTFPLMQSLDSIAAKLPAECANGKTAPCTLRAVYRTDDVSWAYGGDRNQFRKRGDWASWLFVAPERGDYSLRVFSRLNGSYNIEVDGDSIGRTATATGSQTFGVQLTKGGHAVRVLDTRDTVTVDSILISYTPLSVRTAGVTMPGEAAAQCAPLLVSGWGDATRGETQRAVVPQAGTLSPQQTSIADNAPAAAAHPTLVASAMVATGTVSDATPQGPRPQAVRGDGFVSPQQPKAVYVPHDMRWKPERACLPVMGVQASSESGRSRATAVADFDLRTRWTPAGSGPQWLTLDLGTVRDVAAVSLVWYSARRAEIRCVVEVSADGVRFTAIDALPLTGRGTQTVTRTFASAQARFIRLQLDTVRGACPSVYEAGVHGTSE